MPRWHRLQTSCCRYSSIWSQCLFCVMSEFVQHLLWRICLFFALHKTVSLWVITRNGLGTVLKMEVRPVFDHCLKPICQMCFIYHLCLGHDSYIMNNVIILYTWRRKEGSHMYNYTVSFVVFTKHAVFGKYTRCYMMFTFQAYGNSYWYKSIVVNITNAPYFECGTEI